MSSEGQWRLHQLCLPLLLLLLQAATRTASTTPCSLVSGCWAANLGALAGCLADCAGGAQRQARSVVPAAYTASSVTLAAGDTFDTISQYFGIPRSYITDANPDVNPATLAVNSFVRLPPYADTCPPPGNNQQCRIYVAQQGDSLSIIATAFSLALADVQASRCRRRTSPTPPARHRMDCGPRPPLACPALANLPSCAAAPPPHPTLQAANQGVDGSTGDGSMILQPGQRIKLPPFPDTCGAGEGALDAFWRWAAMRRAEP